MRTTLLALVWVAATACGDNLHHNNADAQSGDGPTIDSKADITPDAAPMCTTVAGGAVLGSMTSGDMTVDATQSENTALTLAAIDVDHSILFTSMREIEPSPAFGAVACDLIATGVHCKRASFGTDDAASTGVVNIHYVIATFSSGVTVQRGLVDTNVANPTEVTLSPSVDTSKSFVILGGIFGGGTGWGNNEFTRAQLIDGSTLDIRHAVKGSSVRWQVVTMDGASVQRGTTALATTDTTSSVTVTPVPFGAMALVSYNTDNPSALAAGIMMLRAGLSGSTLKLDRDIAGSGIDASWEIVSLPYFTRQITTSFDAGAGSTSSAVAGITASTTTALSTVQAVLATSGGSTAYMGTDVDLLGEAAATLAPGADAVTVTRASTSSTAEITWTAVDFSRTRCQ